MIDVRHPARRRRSAHGAMFRHADIDEQDLATQVGLELLARIDAATSEIVADDIDRAEHVARVALVILAARRRARA